MLDFYHLKIKKSYGILSLTQYLIFTYYSNIIILLLTWVSESLLQVDFHSAFGDKGQQSSKEKIGLHQNSNSTSRNTQRRIR